MRSITAKQIAEAVEGSIIHGAPETEVRNISTDTRSMKPDSLFIPLQGERYDGHRFIQEAAEKGAKVILADREGEYFFPGTVVLRVDNTLAAFHRLAAWYRGLFDVDFVAVTGSTGKTTTKNMIAAVLGKKFSVLKTPGNFNNQIGLPLTIMKLEEGHEVSVVEMGMSGFGEIAGLVDIVRPRVSVITNIGTSHIELLGSRENILKAKMEIFDGMAAKGHGLVNTDDPLLREGIKTLCIPVTTFGTEDCDYKAVDIQTAGENGIAYTLQAEGGHYRIQVPLPGRHNVYNSLAAVAVGRIFGMSYEEIAEGLKGIKEEKMRLNIFTSPEGVKVINDTYNASPDSMKAALEVLNEIAEGRKIAVLGDMLEMGDYTEEGHRLVGAYAARNRVDILVTVGNNSVHIGHGARDEGMKRECIYHFQDKEKAGLMLDRLVQKNDTVLFKGSRGMKMEELAGRIQERS